MKHVDLWQYWRSHPKLLSKGFEFHPHGDVVDIRCGDYLSQVKTPVEYMDLAMAIAIIEMRMEKDGS